MLICTHLALWPRPIGPAAAAAAVDSAVGFVAAAAAVPRFGTRSIHSAPMQSRRAQIRCSYQWQVRVVVEVASAVGVRSSVPLCYSALPWAEWPWY